MNKLIVETAKLAGKALIEATAITTATIVGIYAGFKVVDVTASVAKRIPGTLKRA